MASTAAGGSGEVAVEAGTENAAIARNANEDMTKNANTRSGAFPDALATLNSTWAGWVGGGSTTRSEGAEENKGDWLGGANRLWQNAVQDVGRRLRDAKERVDSANLEESVGALRQLELGQLSAASQRLVEQATTTLRTSREEAMQMFVDEDRKDAAVEENNDRPPWEKLADGEEHVAGALQREVLQMTVDCVYSQRKRESMFVTVDVEDDGDVLDRRADEAKAALRAHDSLRRLRAMLVPARMKEQRFWAVYFSHVGRVRETLLANGGQLPEVGEAHEAHGVHDEDDEDDEESLSWRRGA